MVVTCKESSIFFASNIFFSPCQIDKMTRRKKIDILFLLITFTRKKKKSNDKDKKKDFIFLPSEIFYLKG